VQISLIERVDVDPLREIEIIQDGAILAADAPIGDCFQVAQGSNMTAALTAGRPPMAFESKT
jgi:hypothetical protein